MITFEKAVSSSFVKDHDGFCHSFRFGDGGRYELTLEPLLGGQYYLALYDHVDKDQEPLGGARLMLQEKVPIRTGGSRSDE